MTVRMRRPASIVALSVSSLLLGCGGDPKNSAADPAPSGACDPAAAPSRTIACVEAFTPGEAAGFGMDELPDIIYGEPKGGGISMGGTDVLSLGAGGEITVGFGGNSIVDGPGADFILFENAFYVGGDPAKPWKELGEVSVSEDGEEFIAFPCASETYPFEGCAGWHAVIAGPGSGVSSFDPEEAGGDPFDLATIGLGAARFVRVKDLATWGQAPSAGFDLDAIAIVNPAVP
jgi:hypothetical protein